MNKKVYLDYAATTYVSGEVMNEMLPCFNMIYGNSSSLHSFGREAMAVVDRSRDRIAQAINAQKSNEIYFTNGGTEANNWVIKGIAHANANKGRHIITSQIEHESILESCKQLEKEGFQVTYLPVDEYGVVSLAELMHALTKETILVSIMSANNEVGTVQNIKALAKTAHEKGALFHTDAVQAFGAFRFDVQDMGIDLMTISSHKLYGPKGAGALYVRNGVRIANLIDGGNQERNKRGGTVNVPAVAGFGKAVELAIRDMNVNQQKIKAMREYFISQITEKIPDIVINGHPQQKVNGIVSVSFNYIEGESILLTLDLDGIAVSTGSACTSGSLEPSHVLRAMGIPDEIAQGTIRFSFGKSTSKSDVEYTVEKLVEAVAKLRAISPLTKTKGRK